MTTIISKLNDILDRFVGQPCAAPPVPRGGFQLFQNLDLSPFHASATFGIHRDIRPNIGVFMSYHLLSVINTSPLASRRFLNNQWYVFKQLPLCVAIKEDGLSNTVLIENPTTLSWPEFLKACQSGGEPIAVPMAAEIGHQMTTVPFGYNGPITRRPSLPHFAISHFPGQLTLSLTAPRMHCMPVEFNRLFNSIREHLSNAYHPQATNTVGM